MTASSQLDIQTRDKLGKGASRALRRDGRIPAVLYGGTDAPLHFSLNSIQLNKELHQKGFMSKIFEIPLAKKKEKALVRLIQFHPVSDRPLHVDFFRVAEGDTITLSVPVTFHNEEASPGLKRGGVLNILLHSLEIVCDLSHIPDSIDVDLTGLDIQDAVHLANIKLPTGVTALHPERDSTLANIVPPKIMKEEAAEEVEEAAEEEGAAESEEESGETAETEAPAEGE